MCLEAGSRTGGTGLDLDRRGRKGDSMPAATQSLPSWALSGGHASATMQSELSCDRRRGVETQIGEHGEVFGWGSAFSAKL